MSYKSKVAFLKKHLISNCFSLFFFLKAAKFEMTLQKKSGLILMGVIASVVPVIGIILFVPGKVPPLKIKVPKRMSKGLEISAYFLCAENYPKQASQLSLLASFC